MITKVQADNYRCLHHISTDLRPFQILVGPNGSGKTTFLDILGFLSDTLTKGLAPAVDSRSKNFHDLVWGREQNSFSFTLTAQIPQEHRWAGLSHVCYSTTVRLDPKTDAIVFANEGVSIGDMATQRHLARRLTTESVEYLEANTSQTRRVHQSTSILPTVINEPEFQSALTWFLALLRDGIHRISLTNGGLTTPTPSGRGLLLGTDGSNLPRLVSLLKDEYPDRFHRWIQHLRTVVPDLQSVHSVLRPEDRHRYLTFRYQNGVEVPSWMASEGTLRLAALTVLAYAPVPNSIYLIEEPENGIHPLAIEAVYESLHSVYEGQVLLTSHSPVLLSIAAPEDLLCFTRSASEGVAIIPGNLHPKLKDWHGEPNLSELFAAGVLA